MPSGHSERHPPAALSLQAPPEPRRGRHRRRPARQDVRSDRTDERNRRHHRACARQTRRARRFGVSHSLKGRGIGRALDEGGGGGRDGAAGLRGDGVGFGLARERRSVREGVSTT